MDIFNQSEKFYNKPLIPSDFNQDEHLIYLKYTSEEYFKYCIDILNTLCKKSNAENQQYLYHVSLFFFFKIIYNCGNSPCLSNLDLLLISIFSLSMKITSNQHNSPNLNVIKKIYPEKYSNYKNEDIIFGEIVCLKKLKYNINILTPYECLLYILKKNNKLYLLDLANREFQKNLYKQDKKLIFLSPMDIASKCINQIKGRIVLKKQIVLLKNKPINCKEIQKAFSSSFKNNEFVFKGASSSFIGNINNKNINNKKYSNNEHKQRVNFSNEKINKVKEEDYFYSKYYNYKIGKNNNNSNKKSNNMSVSKNLIKTRHCLYDSNICLDVSNNKLRDKEAKNLKYKNNSTKRKNLNEERNTNSYYLNSSSKATQRSANNIFKKKLHLNSIDNALNNLNYLHKTNREDTKENKMSSRINNLNIKKLNHKNVEGEKIERIKKFVARRKCGGNSLNCAKFNFDKISDLCQKINFDFFNNICKEK